MKTIFRNLIVAAAMCTAVAATAADNGKLFIIGNSTPCGWDLDMAQALLSTSEHPNVYTGTLYLKSGDGNDFKFMQAHEWGSTEYGLPVDSESSVVSGETALATGSLDEGYKKLAVAQDGNYYISIDTESLKANVVLADYQSTEINYTSLFAVGGATPGGWSVEDGTPLYQQADKPYEYKATVKLNAAPESFKIATSLRGAGSFDAKYYIFRDAEDDTKISTDATDDRQWSVSKAGYYDVAVNTVDATISISEADTSAVENLTVSSAAEVTFFNLQGQKVNNPSKGIFILVSADGVKKVMID